MHVHGYTYRGRLLTLALTDDCYFVVSLSLSMVSCHLPLVSCLAKLFDSLVDNGNHGWMDGCNFKAIL